MTDLLRAYLYDRLLPLITGPFLAPEGLFYERLHPNLEPDGAADRRLTAQCRQVFTVSLLAKSRQHIDLAAQVFDRIRQLFYHGPGGGWIFSVDAALQPASQERDLYAHSFVLLACAGLLKNTGKDIYLSLARETLSFIETYFRHSAGGFYEALSESLQPIDRTRRQNPHMHLFEAYLAMYEFSHDRRFLEAADRIFALFTSKFLDSASATLREYFDQGLSVCPARGHVIEPGHHFEWAYLLSERVRIGKDLPAEKAGAVRALAEKLTGRGLALGWDRERGGIYNEVTPAGDIVNSSKRIWPLLEGMKAAALFARNARPSAAELTRFAFAHYLNQQTGTWMEQLNCDLRPARTELPGTTPYHIAVSLVTLASLPEEMLGLLTKER